MALSAVRQHRLTGFAVGLLHPSRRRTVQDLLAVLVDRGHREIHQLDAALLADGFHGRGRVQRVARPDLVGEAS